MLSTPFRLQPDDLPACLKLSQEANWNQNAADWGLILSSGIGFGLRRGGDLVASAAVMPYGRRFGWICMVLVTQAERRRGLASRLMRECMEWLRARNAIAGLDATPAGREVYRQLGFCDIYNLTRLQRTGAAPAPASAFGPAVAPLTRADLEEVARYDAAAFGEDRSALLATWLGRLPEAAHCARVDGRVTGFVLARDGRVAAQIGPLVANDEPTAIALLGAALAHLDGTVFIDLADRHAAVGAWLAEQGFTAQRPYTRMLLGHTEPLDRPNLIMAVTGPEFG